MIEAPTPANEPQRLAALRALGLLDGKPERAFDDITELARRLLDVPIALVSLVDVDRQWFLSAAGLDAQETPRPISFCGHAIMQSDILIVPDATLDPRFHDNPLVVGDPFLRFYAGQPLRLADGMQIGTLCVLSPAPREDFDEMAQRTLARLGRLTLDAIALHAMRAELARSHMRAARIGNLWDRLDTALATTENDGRIEACNAAFKCLCTGDPIGRPADEALGIVWSPLEMAQAATQNIDCGATRLTVERTGDGFLFIGRNAGG